MRRQKQRGESAPAPAPSSGQANAAAQETPAWSPPGGSTSRRRPSLRRDTSNATRKSSRVTSYPEPGAGFQGDPNVKGQPKTSSYPKTAGNVGHRGYQAIN